MTGKKIFKNRKELEDCCNEASLKLDTMNLQGSAYVMVDQCSVCEAGYNGINCVWDAPRSEPLDRIARALGVLKGENGGTDIKIMEAIEVLEGSRQ